MTGVRDDGHGLAARVVDFAAYRQARSSPPRKVAGEKPLPQSRPLSAHQAVHRRRMLAHLVAIARER